MSQWVKTRTSIGQTFEVVKGAITGETAAPGALRTITASEVSSFPIVTRLSRFQSQLTQTGSQLELARKVENKQI